VAGDEKATICTIIVVSSEMALNDRVAASKFRK